MNLWKVISRHTKRAMIDPFAQAAWADAHERFSADVAAGLAGLARWLRRRAKAGDGTPNATSGYGE